MFNKKSLAGLILILIVTITASAQVKVNYEVSFKQPQAHYAEVEMNIDGLSAAYTDVKMPAWAPGSYLIREFAKNVEGFTASAAGKILRTEKVKKNTWRIYNGTAKALKINYSVYAFEVSVRTSFIDDTHAFLSSTGIFMYPDKQLAIPSTVTIVPFSSWSKVSTGLPAVEGRKFTYFAKNYDILYDSPIEVGNQDIFEFMAAGVKHEVAMYGGGNYNAEKLKVDMAKVVEAATAVYGENPNKNYTFIVHNFAKGSGGLEHLNSTVLGASRNAYATEKGYIDFLGLVAHEYHHLWNVKRLRPVALGPFDYENENYTTNLWVAEGFTAYYENKLMLRAGLISPEKFVSNLINATANVINTPGAQIQSAAQSSFDAWIKYYRPDENSNNTSVSYYSKGEVVGLLMDLEIAKATKGAHSLDDVMKAMYEQCKKLNRGYTDAEFKAMVEKISGISFTDFWAKYVNGVYPVEYAKYFGYAGVKIKDENAGNNISYLGATSKFSEGRNLIIAVSRNSAAWIDGLNVNDEVISVDGIQADSVLGKMAVLLNKKPGDTVVIKVKRDLLEKYIKVKLKANPNVKLMANVDQLTEEERVVLKKWMGIN